MLEKGLYISKRDEVKKYKLRDDKQVRRFAKFDGDGLGYMSFTKLI